MKTIVTFMSIGFLLVSCSPKDNTPIDINQLKNQGCKIDQPKDCDGEKKDEKKFDPFAEPKNPLKIDS